MAVVIYHPDDGVFIGECMGFAFWSNIDPAEQPCAVTFKDAQDAREYLASWPDDAQPQDVRFVDVTPDMGAPENPGASVAACVQAGLPGWLSETTGSANALPI